jgi:hypothetical protein
MNIALTHSGTDCTYFVVLKEVNEKVTRSLVVVC